MTQLTSTPSDLDTRADVGTHTVPLAADWRLWRTAGLRGAGFPAQLALELATPEASDAADAFIASERRLALARIAITRELDEATAAADVAARSRIRSIRRKIKRGGPLVDAQSDAARAYQAAIEQRDEMRARAALAYTRDVDDAAARLRRVATSERFREAALWQNRRAYRVAVDKLSSASASPSERRHATEFLAMLLQRYAVKNDSIGFFGPVGWAAVTSDDSHSSCRPGPTLTATRNVYFEEWAIEALVHQLNETPGLDAWTEPRLRSGVWLDGDHVYAPYRGRVTVSDDERALLGLCRDGRTAAEVVEAFRHDRPDAREEGVTAMLTHLVRAGLLRWRLEVAPQLHPEWDLERTLRRIGDAGLRERCLAPVRELIGARDAVQAASGDADALEAALARLDATFTRLTSRAATRRVGEMYAARTLVYEDCRRACEVTIGGRALSRLAAPLALYLNGARWASARWKAEFKRHLRSVHDTLRQRHRSDVIDAHLFVSYVIASAGGMAGTHHRHEVLASAAARVTAEYNERWARILPLDRGSHRLDLDLADVQSAADTAFACADEGTWAGYFSPDVLVRAESDAAFRRGECDFVLGEVHSGHTLLWSALAAQHPDPRQLFAALDTDASGRDVLAMQVPRAISTARLTTFVAPSYWLYEHADERPSMPRCRSLPAGRLVAVDTGDRVELHARDGSLRFDAYDVFSQMLYREISTIINAWLPARPHLPRVTIGALTLARESWMVRPSALPFIDETDEPVRFARIRAWARDGGLPRHVFYKCPGERKPCHLDLASAMSCQLFVKMLERCRHVDEPVRITEMLPTVDEAWLTDREANRYTSELRIVAFHRAGVN